jgi:hypothetical protein
MILFWTYLIICLIISRRLRGRIAILWQLCNVRTILSSKLGVKWCFSRWVVWYWGIQSSNLLLIKILNKDKKDWIFFSQPMVSSKTLELSLLMGRFHLTFSISLGGKRKAIKMSRPLVIFRGNHQVMSITILNMTLGKIHWNFQMSFTIIWQGKLPGKQFLEFD